MVAAKAKSHKPPKPSKERFIGCILKQLPDEQVVEAANTAKSINPTNQPAFLSHKDPDTGEVEPPSFMRIAVLTTKYWGAKGVKLSVGFVDSPEAALRTRILGHMNSWGQNGRSNVTFQETSSAMAADVRIARENSGYWSYLGTDILHIPRNQQTMNLQGFTMNTPDSEFYRVVRHETGHTLGFPHEHMRGAIIAKLDRQKTISYFERTQGWSEQEVVAQVLTPIEENAIIGTPQADETSIMTYQLPGSITKDGKPIVGGNNTNSLDYDFCAKIYPGTLTPPPGGGEGELVLTVTLDPKTLKITGSTLTRKIA